MSEKRFCPNCGSTDIEPDNRKVNQAGEDFASINTWICNECDYSGIMPEGDPEEFEKTESSTEKMRFCPNCGSTWVEPDTSNRAEVYFSGGNPNKWQCNKCGYTGLMPEGDPNQDFDENSEAREIEFEPDENYSREDIGFGRGYLRYLLYVTLPAITAYALYLMLFKP